MQPDRLNCYLPTRTDDTNSLDDLIQTLTESLISVSYTHLDVYKRQV